MDTKTRAYLRERRRLSGSFSISRDVVAGLIGALLFSLLPANPTGFKVFLFGVVGAVGGIVVVELVLFLARFIWVTPKTMYLDALRDVDRIEREHASAKDEAEALRAKWKIENHGIELRCTEIKFSWGPDPDLPAGVLVVVDVDRIVNGNIQDAVLDVTLVAPVWRSGAFKVTTSSRALATHIEQVKTKLPQFPPLINLSKKQGLGPGYFLFFYGFESWQNFPFVPESDRAKTLDEFAALICASELEIHIHERANHVHIPPVLAPGTLDKRVKRQEEEKRMRKTEST